MVLMKFGTFSIVVTTTHEKMLPLIWSGYQSRLSGKVFALFYPRFITQLASFFFCDKVPLGLTLQNGRVIQKCLEKKSCCGLILV